MNIAVKMFLLFFFFFFFIKKNPKLQISAKPLHWLALEKKAFYLDGSHDVY